MKARSLLWQNGVALQLLAHGHWCAPVVHRHVAPQTVQALRGLVTQFTDENLPLILMNVSNVNFEHFGSVETFTTLRAGMQIQIWKDMSMYCVLIPHSSFHEVQEDCQCVKKY